MISYRLKCQNDHIFDSWFKSSEDFDKLQSRKLLTCDICGSHQVEKTLMTPQTPKKRQNTEPHPLEIYRKEVKDKLKNAKNVGWQFAKEARAIHYGDKEDVPIYGKTDPEDAMDLLKEGINIAPLPFDPDEKEN